MEKLPKPVSPRNSTAIASAVNFTWTSVPQASDYELAICNESDFIESALSINTGPTNVLTLYETLPEDGKTRYWKVRAMQHAKWSEWSEVVAFVSGTTEGPIERPVAQTQRTAKTVPQATRSQSSTASTTSTPVVGQVQAILPPGLQQGASSGTGGTQTNPFDETLDGTTSVGRAAAFFSIMVLSFLALLAVITTAIPN